MLCGLQLDSSLSKLTAVPWGSAGKGKKERGKETKEVKDRRKKWTSNNGLNFHSLSQVLLAKLWSQICFLRTSQILHSYPGNWKETGFAFNYQNRCLNPLFIWSVQIFLLFTEKYLLVKCNSLFSFLRTK